MSKKNDLHKLSLKLDGHQIKDVHLDGRMLSGVQTLKFQVSDDYMPPKVVIEMYVSSIKVEADGVHVKMLGNDVDLLDMEF